MPEVIENKKDSKMQTIRDLLARAENTSSQPEAESCIRKAQELMIIYSVDEEELWRKDPSRKQAIEIVEFKIADKAVGSMQRRMILNQIALLSNCKMWYSPGTSTSKVAGFPNDLLFVQMMYVSVTTQMNFHMAMAQAMSDEHPKVFRSNFLDAFSSRICRRLQEMYREASDAVTTTGGNQLVLRDRKTVVDDWVERQVGKLRASSQRSNGRYSGSAQGAGSNAANHTDISGTRRGINKGQKRIGS